MNSEERIEEYILAIDIGGTKVSAALVTDDGRILSKLFVPTMQEGPKKGIAQIISLVDTVIQNSEINPEHFAGIGIGIPAVLERDTDFILWGPNLKDWKNVDLKHALSNHFQLPVCIEYDGHTAVLGEWWMGIAKDYQSVVNIIIGTGVGGGLILEGKLIRGFNRLAGAAGWFVINPKADIKSKGEKKLGRWESSIAGPGIARRAYALLKSKPECESILRSKGKGVTSKDVFDAAHEGDDLAMQIADETAELLGMGIANIISLVNPEIVILGGSVGSNSSLLLPRIRLVVENYAQPFSGRSAKIVTSKLESNAGLYGAAYGMILRLKDK